MDWNNHVYINLDKRGDRNTKTIKQLMKLGITKPNRFSAIEHQHGIIGCALSHIKVIENAIGKELPYIKIKIICVCDTNTVFVPAVEVPLCIHGTCRQLWQLPHCTNIYGKYYNKS